MKILLPNSTFGALLMLATIVLIVATPFALAFWAVSLIAPWWVALPSSLLVSLIVFVTTVKFKS